jgi:hypothetical protein
MYNRVFDVMPLAAFINNRVFSVHGGSLKEIGRIEQIVCLRPSPAGPNERLVLE